MNAPAEEPLGETARERPSPQEVAEVWAEALKDPVPDYDPAAVRRALACLYARER